MRLKIYVNCGPGDNPAQSEVCGHIGGNGNHPCRKCFVGGPQQVKETDNGFHSLFEVQFVFLLLYITDYWIEFFRLVLLAQLKESSQMSNARWNWPVWVLPRMYRLSRLKMASKTVTPNSGLMILLFVLEHYTRTILDGQQLIFRLNYWPGYMITKMIFIIHS